MSVEAYVTRDDRAWHASIQVRDASTGKLGSREFASESDSCAALEAAVALAVALVIDPDAPLSAPAPEVASVAAPAPSAAPGPLPPVRAAMTPLPEAHRRASFALHGTLAGGLLPGAAEGVDVTWSLGRWIGPSVSAFFFPEQRTPDRAFGFGLTALGLGACARPPGRSALEPGLCAHLFAGALHAVVYEFVPTRPGAQAWVAASLAPHLRMSLGSRLFVELGGEIVVPLLRDTFQVDGWSDPVFRQWPIAVRGFAGLGTDFP